MYLLTRLGALCTMLNNILSFRAFAAAFCVLVAACFSSINAQSSDAFVSDEVLVKFADSASAEKGRAALRRANASLVEDLGDLGWQRVKIPAGMTAAAAMDSY